MFMYFAVIIFFSQKGEFYSGFQRWKTMHTVEGSFGVFFWDGAESGESHGVSGEVVIFKERQ